MGARDGLRGREWIVAILAIAQALACGCTRQEPADTTTSDSQAPAAAETPIESPPEEGADTADNPGVYASEAQRARAEAYWTEEERKQYEAKMAASEDARTEAPPR